MRELRRLFNPRAIAIIGVNDKPYGGGYFLNCLKLIGYENPLYLFNPRLKGQIIKGEEVYSSILDIPKDKPIDYAILAVPAQKCPSLLEEAGIKGIKFVTIFTSGFSEVGNINLEEQLLRIARRYKIRLIGPNCLGIYNPEAKIGNNRLHVAKSGSFGVISQSGGLAIAISNKAIYTNGTYISKLISIGNQIDLDVLDFLNYFLNDKKTKFIGVYLENLKQEQAKKGRKILDLILKLSQKGKPVILWKVGNGKSTQEAIISHTGGMSGSRALWKGAAKQSGAILVNGVEELVNTAMIFNYIGLNALNRDVGVVAVGGGLTIEMTEQLEFHNFNIPKINEKTKKKLLEILPDVNVIFRNPLDLGGSGLNPHLFSQSLIKIAQDPNISALIFVKTYYFTEEFIKEILKAKRHIEKPLICVSPKIFDDVEQYTQKLEYKKRLFSSGIPIFESIEIAARCLDNYCKFHEFLEKIGVNISDN